MSQPDAERAIIPAACDGAAIRSYSRRGAYPAIGDTRGAVFGDVRSVTLLGCSSPGTVVGVTKSLAVEFGPHDIRVLATAPTLIKTRGIDAGAAAFRGATPGQHGRLIRTAPPA